jgi:predicted nucleic acid-binding Zn ribbon protein
MKASIGNRLRNRSAEVTATTNFNQSLLTNNTLNMTTYVYETIPSKASEKPRYFEIKQNMNAKPLTKHPETGEPIRRVVLGGFGLLSSRATASSSSGGGCCSGPSCCG